MNILGPGAIYLTYSLSQHKDHKDVQKTKSWKEKKLHIHFCIYFSLEDLGMTSSASN